MSKTSTPIALKKMDPKKLIELTEDFICTSNIDGRFTYVNPACFKIFGYSQEEMLRVPFIELIHPDDVEKTTTEFDHIKKTGKATLFFNRYFHKDGSIKYISWKSRLDKEEGLIYAIGRDVTEEKNIEFSLKSSEEKFKQLLDLSVTGIVIHKNGIIYDHNAMLSKMFGYENEYLKGVNGLQLMSPPTQNEDLLKKINEASASPYRAIGRKKDGTNFPIEIKGKSLTDAYGETYRVSSVVDISDRVAVEKKLNESQNLFNSAVDMFSEGFVIQDQSDKVILSNKAAPKILGLTMNQLLGKNALDPHWKGLHEDGTPFKADEYPSITAFKTRKPVSNVVMNITTGENDRKFILINSQPFIEGKELIGTVTSFLDITDLKNLERAKEKLLKQSQLAIKTAKLGVWTFDIATGCNEWNDELLKIYGLSRKDFENDLDGWRKQLHPEDVDAANEGLAKIFEGESVFGIEFRIIRKNGEIRHIEASGTPIYNDANELIEVIGINVDVTDKKHGEEELKLSEEKFANAFNHAPNPTSILNLKTREHIATNDAFCETFGYTRSELLSGNIAMSDLAADPDEYKKALNLIFQTGILDRYAIDMITKSGEIRSMLVYGTKLYPGNDDIYIGSFVDVTESKEYEKKLKDSDRVFNLAIDMFCIAGFDGYFKYLNPAWERTLGWSAEELLSKPWVEFTHPDDRGKTEDIKTVLIDGKELYQFENRYICKDGSVKWLSWNSQPFTDEKIMVGAARDITNEKEYKDKIRRSNKLLDASQGIAMVGGWEYDLVHKNLFWTREMYNIHDVTPEDFIPSIDGWLDFYKAEHKVKLANALKLALKSGEGYDLELRLETKKGRKIYVKTNCKATIVDGKTVSLVGAIQDITSQKETEIENSKFSKVIEQSFDSIVITDTDGIIEYVNPGFSRISGYSFDEAIGEKPGILQSGQHDKAFYKNMWDTISSGKIWNGEFLNKKKNGEPYWESANIIPMKDENGAITNYAAIKADITEKKEILLKIKEAKNKAEDGQRYLDSLIKNIGDPVFVKDEDSRIKIVNNSFCELFGASREKIIGTKYVTNSSPDQNKLYIEEDQKVLQTGEENLTEQTIAFNNGEAKSISIRKNRFIDHSGKKFIIGTIRDLTEIKKYRDHLEDIVRQRTSDLEFRSSELTKVNKELRKAKAQAQKALQKEKELGELKSKFVSTASHQFRTPLTVIQSNIELMEMNLDHLEENLRNRFLKSFSRINKESSRMTHLMEDVLTLGQINAEAVMVNPTWIKLDEIGKDLTNSLNGVDCPSKIHLEITNKAKELFLDKNQINHILLNILQNGQKYSLDRGDVNFQIYFYKDKVTLTIKDQGIGMYPEDLKNIFQPFSRGRNTEGIQGTGLGMSIVEEYVKLNKGKIAISSEVNVGTTVEISFEYNT